MHVLVVAIALGVGLAQPIKFEGEGVVLEADPKPYPRAALIDRDRATPADVALLASPPEGVTVVDPVNQPVQVFTQLDALAEPIRYPAATSQRLTQGRTVLYALPADHPRAGELRPAIVTRAWSDTMANLSVILDGMNDGANILPVGSASLDPTPQNVPDMGKPGCWYWPNRV